MEEKDLKNRMDNAGEFLTEDTYGSMITGWVITNPDTMSLDWRLKNIAELKVSKGWKALLAMVRRYKDSGGIVTYNTVEKELWRAEGLDMQTRDHMSKLLFWARKSAGEMDESDYEDAMRQVWLETRKEVLAEGMIKATQRMYQEDLDKGIADAIDVIDRVRCMSEQKASGINTMAELTAHSEDEYGASQGKPMRTGFYRLDEATLGGMRKGQLWLLAAYVSQGKTATAKEIAYRMVMDGHRVMWVSLEMTKLEVRSLFEARHSHEVSHGGIEYGAMLQEQLSEKDKAIWKESVRQWRETGIGDRLIIYVPDEDVTAQDIIHRAETMHRKNPIDLIVVDYSELLVPIRRREQYRIELADTIRRLKTAAGGFGGGDGVAVLLLHQVSRSGYDAACRREHYVMSDLAETAAAERHSNVVMWVLQTNEMADDHEMIMGIAKNRSGPRRPMDVGVRIYEDFGKALISDMQLPF